MPRLCKFFPFQSESALSTLSYGFLTYAEALQLSNYTPFTFVNLPGIQKLGGDSPKAYERQPVKLGYSTSTHKNSRELSNKEEAAPLLFALLKGK